MNKKSVMTGPTLFEQEPQVLVRPCLYIRQASCVTGNSQINLFWRWQQSTRSANQALRVQQLQLADEHYQQALLLAEQLRLQDDLQESCLAAFVISLHNLADLALLKGEPDRARCALKRAFRELWHQMKQRPADMLLPHLQVMTFS